MTTDRRSGLFVGRALLPFHPSFSGGGGEVRGVDTVARAQFRALIE